jgi:YHS domain-containing protein
MMNPEGSVPAHSHGTAAVQPQSTEHHHGDAAATPPASAKKQTICPVMGGKINKEIYVDYQGKRIYFCCHACVDEFNKDPEKYLKKMQSEGIEPESVGDKTK